MDRVNAERNRNINFDGSKLIKGVKNVQLF